MFLYKKKIFLNVHKNKKHMNVHPLNKRSGLGSLTASAWNLNENVFDGRTGGYWLLSWANVRLLEIKLWIAENILAFFCPDSMFTQFLSYGFFSVQQECPSSNMQKWIHTSTSIMQISSFAFLSLSLFVSFTFLFIVHAHIHCSSHWWNIFSGNGGFIFVISLYSYTCLFTNDTAYTHPNQL